MSTARLALRRPHATLAAFFSLPSIFCFFLSCTSTTSKTPAPTAPTPTVIAVPDSEGIGIDKPIPLDPAVTAGRLPNGVRYFVRRNVEPQERAELWLAIDAGSVQEDEDQLGLAHFLEHMAFNGTRRFPKGELVSFLESLGIRFGADLNASTSFDETIYTLSVPTDDPAMLTKAFDVLEDWACCLSLEPADVEAEKGVVIEEWRLGRGASARIRDRQLPILWRDSLYAQRLPIGDPKILATATPELLRRFYRDWYRPDLMTVIAVGDFEPTAVEREIRERFGRLSGPPNARPRVSPPVPLGSQSAVDVASDPEITVASAAVTLKRPAEKLSTLADYRRNVVRSLWGSIVRLRLDELRRAEVPPFLAAFVGGGPSLRTSSSTQIAVTAEPAKLAPALRTALQEVERARRFGVTAGELERAKAGRLRALESAYAERDQTESGDLASELLSYALEEEASPGIARELEMLRELLPTITLDEVNQAAQAYRADLEPPVTSAPVLLASGPRKEGISLPDAATLGATLDGLAELALEPYRDQVSDAPLVADPPAGGSIVAESRLGDQAGQSQGAQGAQGAFGALGVLDWRLSNGIRVLVKPTDFKADEVHLDAYRFGGTSNASDTDYVSASFATAVLGEGGLGPFDAVTLRKHLTGRIAGAAPLISELEDGVSAFASPRDLETMFQLVYLAVTSPRPDPTALASFRERARRSLENRMLQPQAVFQDEMTRVLSNDHPRRRPPTPETLDAIDLDTSTRFFRSRFADARGFTFVVVGSVDPATLRPLVEKWLGGLPASAEGSTPASSYRDIGVHAPDGTPVVVVRRGIEPKATVQQIFHGEGLEGPPGAIGAIGTMTFSRESLHDARALADALRIELREVLREDDGGVYGVSVSASVTDRPRLRRSVAIGFGCDPARVEGLLADLAKTLERFRREGPKPETVTKVREAQRRERELALRDNGFWVSGLKSYLSRGWDAGLILRFDELLERVTVERIRDTSRILLDPSRVVTGELLPAS